MDRRRHRLRRMHRPSPRLLARRRSERHSAERRRQAQTLLRAGRGCRRRQLYKSTGDTSGTTATCEAEKGFGIFGQVNKSTSIAKIRDGTSNTIMTGELQRIIQKTTDCVPSTPVPARSQPRRLGHRRKPDVVHHRLPLSRRREDQVVDEQRPFPVAGQRSRQAAPTSAWATAPCGSSARRSIPTSSLCWAAWPTECR